MSQKEARERSTRSAVGMKAADLRRLTISFHRDNGQRLETAAPNTSMSRRSLTRFLSDAEETSDAYFALDR